MRRTIFAIFAVMAAGLASIGGCNPGKDVSKPIVKKEHDHDETGPHKGALGEFGDDLHVEFTVNHGDKKAIVYILDESAKGAAAIPVETLTLILTHEKTPIEIVLKAEPDAADPKGKSSRFVAVHDEFAKEIEFRGNIRGTIPGKDPYDAPFAEKADHKIEKKKS